MLEKVKFKDEMMHKNVEIKNTMSRTKVIPVFFHSDWDLVKLVFEIAYHSGISVFEFTDRGKEAERIFPQLIELRNQNFKEMIVGIGSVANKTKAKYFVEQGAEFVVTPYINQEVGKYCDENDILWSPGCGTLTEIMTAIDLKAEIVKLFPADSAGGSSFIKSVLAPCPWLKIMPTGGVSLENLDVWLEAGAYCVGMGSQLIPKNILETKNRVELQNYFEKAMSIVNNFKNTGEK